MEAWAWRGVCAHRTRERSTPWRRLPLRWPSAARVPARVRETGRVDWRLGSKGRHGRAGQGTCTACWGQCNLGVRGGLCS